VSEFQKLDLAQLDPNPYQPRTRAAVSPETAEQYGKSILKNGLLQIPLVRQAPFGKKGERYEMGDGWLRLAGHKWLVEKGHPEFKQIQVEVRNISDEQMAQMVFEANGVRKDLDPIEKAQYFKKYLADFKITEQQLADKLSISQGEVANTLRLLDLPNEIQSQVSSGAIPQTHARHLIRLNVKPEEQKKLAQEVVKGGLTVDNLSRKIDTDFWEHSKSLNPKGDSYNKPKFDLAICQGCVSRVQGQDPWGNQKKEDRCILVSCWDKKQKEAETNLEKQALEAAKKKGGEKIFTSKTLQSNAYEFLERNYQGDVDRFDRSQCETCPKVGKFKYDLNDKSEDVRKICLDPACMRAKKSAFSREKNKRDKELDLELTKQLSELFHQIHARPTDAMVILARHAVNHIQADDRVDLMRIFPSLPKGDNGRMDNDAVLASLGSKSLEDLTDLAVAAIFTSLRRQHNYSGNNYSTKISDEIQYEYAHLRGKFKEYLKTITEFQEINCRGCNLANEKAIGTGVDCCKQHYNKQIQKDGRCKYSPAVKAEKEKPETKTAAGETKAVKPGKKPAKTETPAPAAAGPAPRENVQGLLEVICDNKTMEDVYDTFSAASLNESSPKIKGLYELDGKQYVCTGAVLQGGKIIEADCYVAVLVRDYDGKSVHASKKDLLAGYDGVFGECNGFGYVLSGSVVKFVPGKADNNKERPVEKTKKLQPAPKPSASKKTTAKEEPILPKR
jgi:ParB/RepB/Spo0J family partition protein